MRYMTAGESHGPQLTAIVEGVPAGVKVSEDALNADMARRQAGYGRGGRQAIERDKAHVVSGVRFGKTIGTPVAFVVENRDWRNWTDRMAVFGNAPANLKRETTPRPGHADLVGALKIAATCSSARAHARRRHASLLPASRANSSPKSAWRSIPTSHRSAV